MITYLKKNALNFLIGVLIGVPIALYVVSHQQATVLVKYDKELFKQSHESVADTPEVVQETLIYESTPDDIEEEMYWDSLELLALCIEAEAGNQGLIGKKYVCDVILNRVDDEDFPDNITDVIMQKYQFSVVLDGRIWEVEPTEETFQAVREELEERTNRKVLFFSCEGYSEYATDWKKIGDHYFSTK